MINELRKMMIDAYCTRKEEVVQGLTSENESLKTKVLDLLEKNARLQEKVEILDKSLKSALDEIVSNQKRIDALLRQLSEKNGGK